MQSILCIVAFTGTWCMTRQALHINSVHRAFPKCIQQSYSMKRWALSKVDSTTRLVGDAGCMGQTPAVVYTATYVLSVVEILCSLAADTITSSLHTFYPRGCVILHSFIQGGVVSCPLSSDGVCYRALFYVRGGVILHSFIHGGCLIFLHSFIRGGVLSCTLFSKGVLYCTLFPRGVCNIDIDLLYPREGVILPYFIQRGVLFCTLYPRVCVISRGVTHVRSRFLDKLRRRKRAPTAGPVYRQLWTLFSA